jgi:hypothetical protein
MDKKIPGIWECDSHSTASGLGPVADPCEHDNKLFLGWSETESIWYVGHPLAYFFLFLKALPAHSRPWPLTEFRNHFSQMVGLLGREILLPQGRYLSTGQHKDRINAHTHTHTHTHTHQTSIPEWNSNPRSQRPSGDSSCLGPRSYCDRHLTYCTSPEW